MPALPPLECLRFFDAAARHESFVRAADELQVTAAAVAHRIRVLEAHLRAPLFHRRHRGVRLTDRGRQYHVDIQRILGDIGAATARVRRWHRSRASPTARVDGRPATWHNQIMSSGQWGPRHAAAVA